MRWQGRWLLFWGACLVGVAGALPYAGSWNDGSRLASVESLVDRHTLAIDDSLFVRPALAKNAPAFHPERDFLLRHGTKDKLFIDGHFYSDKPPVISFLMAGLYQVYQWLGGPRAVLRPDLFCWLLTACTSGLAFAFAVLCMESLGRRTGLNGRWLAIWLASFALATVALTYTRHVNNHILLLAVIAGLLCQVVQLMDRNVHPPASCVTRSLLGRLVCIGTLAGLGYNLDLGSGPVLIACLTALILFRTRSPAGMAVYLAALLPWLIAHHALNYALGGTLRPVNSNPQYSTWPGCPFDPSNMTGFLRHSPAQFVIYSLALLFGKHGFIGHNLPLFMSLPALVLIWRHRRSSLAPEGWFAGAWTAGTFLMYAAFSNNYGGTSCSIRWFVPFLAPAYWLLAWLLTQRADARRDFVILSAWGTVLSAIMWIHGPWIMHLAPGYWLIQAAALTSWLLPAILIHRFALGRNDNPEKSRTWIRKAA